MSRQFWIPLFLTASILESFVDCSGPWEDYQKKTYRKNKPSSSSVYYGHRQFPYQYAAQKTLQQPQSTFVGNAVPGLLKNVGINTNSKFRQPQSAQYQDIQEPISQQSGMVGSVPSDEMRQDLARCFQRYENCLVVRAAPFERRLGFTPEQCAEFCVSTKNQPSGGGRYSCRSFVFDTNRRICDLFALTGRQSPADLWTIRGFNYYERANGCSSGRTRRPSPTRPTPVFPTPRPPVFPTQRPSVISRLPRFTPAPSVVPTPSPTRPFSNIGTFCRRGTQPLFQKSDGLQLREPDGSKHEGISEEDCLSACEADSTPNGRSWTCLSMDYIKNTRTCTLRADAASPTGSGTLRENSDSVYYEKLCVANEIGQECRGGIVERFPQRILVGFNEQTSTVTTYQECLELCLGSQKTFGFECRSGMFYYTSPNQEDNCLLNTEDHTLEPELFVEENLEQVEYFSLSECGIRAGVNMGFKTKFQQNKIKLLEESIFDRDDEKRLENNILAGGVKTIRRNKPSVKEDFLQKFGRLRSRANRFKISRRFETGTPSRLRQELRQYVGKTYRQRLIEQNGFV